MCGLGSTSFPPRPSALVTQVQDQAQSYFSPRTVVVGSCHHAQQGVRAQREAPLTTFSFLSVSRGQFSLQIEVASPVPLLLGLCMIPLIGGSRHTGMTPSTGQQSKSASNLRKAFVLLLCRITTDQLLEKMASSTLHQAFKCPASLENTPFHIKSNTFVQQLHSYIHSKEIKIFVWVLHVCTQSTTCSQYSQTGKPNVHLR